MQGTHKVLFRNDAVISGGRENLMLIEFDFAMIINDKYVSPINSNVEIGSNVFFQFRGKFEPSHQFQSRDLRFLEHVT